MAENMDTQESMLGPEEERVTEEESGSEETEEESGPEKAEEESGRGEELGPKEQGPKESDPKEDPWKAGKVSYIPTLLETGHVLTCGGLRQQSLLSRINRAIFSFVQETLFFLPPQSLHRNQRSDFTRVSDWGELEQAPHSDMTYFRSVRKSMYVSMYLSIYLSICTSLPPEAIDACAHA